MGLPVLRGFTYGLCVDHVSYYFCEDLSPATSDKINRYWLNRHPIMCEKFVLNNLCTRGLVHNSWTMFRFGGRDAIWVFCKNGEDQCQMYEYPNWGALKNAKAERALNRRTFISTKKVIDEAYDIRAR